MSSPIARSGEERVGILLLEAQVLVSAPWSSSRTPRCSPYRDRGGQFITVQRHHIHYKRIKSMTLKMLLFPSKTPRLSPLHSLHV